MLVLCRFVVWLVLVGVVLLFWVWVCYVCCVVALICVAFELCCGVLCRVVVVDVGFVLLRVCCAC